MSKHQIFASHKFISINDYQIPDFCKVLVLVVQDDKGRIPSVQQLREEAVHVPSKLR